MRTGRGVAGSVAAAGGRVQGCSQHSGLCWSTTGHVHTRLQSPSPLEAPRCDERVWTLTARERLGRLAGQS